MTASRERQWLLEEKYDGVESSAFFDDLERLAAGEPLAYVIGWVPFLDTKIFLDSRPLIPRPETEWWTKRAINELRPGAHVLDLCAGSGCIGVGVAKALPDSHVDFIEIEARHHATIDKNLRENGIAAKRARIAGGDLFEKAAGPYDAILTNPPYIDPALDRAETNVKTHEPHEALYGGAGGMELIAHILREAPDHLVPGGLLYIEHEPEQAGAIATLASSLPYTSYETFPDQFGVLRYTRLVRSV